MPQPAIPKQILETFYPGQTVTARPLGDGMVNATYLVTAGKDRTVLQKLSAIFNDSMAEDYAAISAHLLAESWEVPSAIAATDGRPYIKDAEDSWWRAFSFIDSDGQVPKDQAKVFAQVGVLLAKLHASLRTLDYVPKFSIPHFHDTSYYLAKLGRLAPQLTGEAKQLAQDVLAAYQDLPALADSQQQLIHGDPRTSNMLFRDGRPFTFIDFDTIMLASTWVDVGDLLRSIVENAVEAQQEFTPEQLRPLTDSYGMEFSQALVATQRITLELAARFLIDIVEDNYFAWDPQQYPSRKAFNLARAQLQWGIHTNLQGALRV